MTDSLISQGDKLKVAFCIDHMVRGGTELQLAGLIDRLDRERFEPVLCTIRPGSMSLLERECRCLEMDVPRLFSPKGFSSVLGFARWLRQERVSVVHTFFQDSTIFAGVAARLANVPVRIAGLRDMGFWQSPGQVTVLKRVYAMMTDFIANAEAVGNYFATAGFVDPRRVRVIRNGIETGAYGFCEHTDRTLNVGIVGNLNRKVKRADLFIRSAALLGAEHPEITWHLVGDGELRATCEALAQDLGIADRMIFAGRVRDVPAYLEQLQIGVLCSDSEGLSNALLEYMLKGCAVVATDVGGTPEVVEHEGTGLLVPPDDAPALAGAVGRLISDIGLRRRLAESADRFVRKEYSWETCVTAHQDFYLNTLASTGRVGSRD